jgi:predicted TIM-barrel fold metal-dependent hydrolase
LVDAHHHLWNLDLHYYPGLTDKPNKNFFLGSIDALRRNYLAENYFRDSCDHNVLTTVHVEAEMSRDSQIEETRWLSQVNEKHGFPGAIVAHAWFHTDNAEEIIARQAAFRLVRGIRSKPVTAESAAQMAPSAPGSMQDERWLRGFALLERYGLSWDLRVPSWHLVEAAEVTPISTHADCPQSHGLSMGSQRRGSRCLASRDGTARTAAERISEGIGVRPQGPTVGL